MEEEKVQSTTDYLKINQSRMCNQNPEVSLSYLKNIYIGLYIRKKKKKKQMEVSYE